MPLLWISAAFLAGICLSMQFPLHWGVWTGLAAAFLIGSLIERRLQKPAFLLSFRKASHTTVSLLLAVFFIGAVRLQLQQPVFSNTDLAYYNNARVQLIGQISDYPDVRDNAVQLALQVSKICLMDSPADISVQGKVLVRLAPGSNWQYGDVVRLKGKLTTPAENEEFSYRDYLETRGIYSTMYYPYADLIKHRTGNPVKQAVFRLREYASRTIRQIFSQPEAGLLSGILLGLEHDIPADLDEAFKKTGTSHIIAISGFNIAILSGLIFSGMLRLLPRYWALPVSILFIALYALMVGGQPSVVRAAIMGSMALIGRQIGRQGTGINSLTFTGAAMCLFNPLLIRDAGFQLSFMATLGLVLYSEPLHDGLMSRLEKYLPVDTARRLAGLGSDYFLFTMAAQVTTLPIIVYHFGRLSYSSLLANLLILPVQPMLMILGGMVMLIGMVCLPVGRVTGFIAGILPDYTIRMVRWLARIPGGSIEMGQISVWWIVFFYLFLFALTLHTGLKQYFPRIQKTASQIRPSVLLAGMMLVCAVIWRAVALLPDGRLHIHVINVPDGPAVWLQMPAGQTVLVNGGSSASRLSSEMGQRLPFFDRRPDAVLVTDRKAKPLAGLPVSMQSYPARLVLWNEEAAALRNGERLSQALQQQEVESAWLETGQMLVADGVTIRVISHTSTGTAMLIEWSDFSMLIPGGIRPQNLTAMADTEISAVDVLLLSATDLEQTGAEEWTLSQPVLVLWTGADHAGMPADDPHWLYVEGLDTIELTTDGRQLWADTLKK